MQQLTELMGVSVNTDAGAGRQLFKEAELGDIFRRVSGALPVLVVVQTRHRLGMNRHFLEKKQFFPCWL